MNDLVFDWQEVTDVIDVVVDYRLPMDREIFLLRSTSLVVE